MTQAERITDLETRLAALEQVVGEVKDGVVVERIERIVEKISAGMGDYPPPARFAAPPPGGAANAVPRQARGNLRLVE